MLVEVTVRIEISDPFVNDVCKDGSCQAEKERLMAGFTKTAVKNALVKDLEHNTEMNVKGVDARKIRQYNFG